MRGNGRGIVWSGKLLSEEAEVTGTETVTGAVPGAGIGTVKGTVIGTGIARRRDEPGVVPVIARGEGAGNALLIQTLRRLKRHHGLGIESVNVVTAIVIGTVIVVIATGRGEGVVPKTVSARGIAVTGTVTGTRTETVVPGMVMTLKRKFASKLNLQMIIRTTQIATTIRITTTETLSTRKATMTGRRKSETRSTPEAEAATGRKRIRSRLMSSKRAKTATKVTWATTRRTTTEPLHQHGLYKNPVIHTLTMNMDDNDPCNTMPLSPCHVNPLSCVIQEFSYKTTFFKLRYYRIKLELCIIIYI